MIRWIKRWFLNHLPMYTAEPSQTQPVRDTKEMQEVQLSTWREIRFYLYRWWWKRQNRRKK